MPITQTADGYHLAIHRKDCPRIRRTFQSYRQAEEFERNHLLKYLGVIRVEPHSAIGQAVYGASSTDDRTLYELLDLWWRYHGMNLADGKRRRAILEAMIGRLGHRIARTLTPEQFLDYRYRAMHMDNPPLSAKSFNNRHGYLNALYSKLRKIKIIVYQSPLAEVDLLKIQERQLSYLSPGQITALFAALKASRNPSAWWISQICLRTGCRWSEAENLTRKQLHNGRVTFEFTKSKKIRTVPLEAGFYDALLQHARLKNPEERLFTNAMNSFVGSVKRAGLKLPKGQCTHILRHSFASHFVMKGGNILTLKEILGHSDIKMTMRYAHLSPDHLNDAVRLNPLAGAGQ
ncbi:MAG: tyrosine-type recombinase/integrase [Methyloglobulus sp.]|nr:tyrosine-type recombinase/integrase [Methyloglobulus sp.]